jgi:hypothetical protein
VLKNNLTLFAFLFSFIESNFYFAPCQITKAIWAYLITGAAQPFCHHTCKEPKKPQQTRTRRRETSPAHNRQ